MPGPLPKHDEARRRRNTEGTGKARVLERRKGDPPPMRARRGGLGWSDEIVEWWAVAWRSQMASQWHEAEHQVVRRYVDLWQTWLDVLDGDRIWSVATRSAGELVRITVDPASSTLLTAMKDCEERLGLSPLARRRMNIELAVDEPTETKQARASSARRRATDPRLRVVEGGKGRRRAGAEEVDRPGGTAADPRK